MVKHVEGVPQAKAYLKRKNNTAKSLLKKGVFNSAVYVQGEVKQSIAGRRAEHISVDTGRFLNSVNLDADDKSARVFSEIPYARKLEYGFSSFKGRSHFRNTAKRVKAKVINIIKSEMAKL